MKSMQEIITSADKIVMSIEKEVELRNKYFKSFSKDDLNKLKIQQNVTLETIKIYKQCTAQK